MVRGSWWLVKSVQEFLKIASSQGTNLVDGLDCEIEPQCIATIPQHPSNGDEDLGPVVFLNLHKSIKKTLEA